MVRRYVSRSALVDREIRNNPFNDRLRVEINYSLQIGPMCGSSVNVDVYLDWLVGRGAAGTGSKGWMPFLGELGTLHGHSGGQVICGRVSDL